MWKELFYLQRNDRVAILAILIVIVVASLIVFFAGDNYTETTLVPVDSLYHDSDTIHVYHNRRPVYYRVETTKPERFPFDPNTADSTQLLRLGLRPWQVRNIYKYRAAGGVYRHPSEFARLYGLTQLQYKELLPYIQISQDYQPAARMAPERAAAVRDTLLYPVKIKPGETIALNTADTTQLKKVPGIGTGWAGAIVRYRERLGGFYTVSQLEEIDGFPMETSEYFVVDPSLIRKINVNQLSLQQLRKHPYVNFYQARAILDYRRLNGPLTSLSQLRLLKEFPPAAIQRLEPYVEF